MRRRPYWGEQGPEGCQQVVSQKVNTLDTIKKLNVLQEGGHYGGRSSARNRGRKNRRRPTGGEGRGGGEGGGEEMQVRGEGVQGKRRGVWTTMPFCGSLLKAELNYVYRRSYCFLEGVSSERPKEGCYDDTDVDEESGK